MKEFEYENLRLDVLQRLIDERGIPYKPSKKDKDTKDTIIGLLKLDDDGKFTRELTYERSGGGFIVGVDLNDHKHLVEIGKMIEKKEAQNLNRFCENRVHYWIPQKLI